jgi:hypothetical protein
MADFLTFKYTVVYARLALFDYEQRYTKTKFFHFLGLNKITAISKVEKEERQDEWKMEKS